jgi:hypothetical protein
VKDAVFSNAIYLLTAKLLLFVGIDTGKRRMQYRAIWESLGETKEHACILTGNQSRTGEM